MGIEDPFLFIKMILSHVRPPKAIFPVVVVFYLLCSYTAASEAASCDVSIYGKPQKDDCLNLFEKFTSSQNLQTRFFDEEQLRVDSDKSWPGVANVFEQPIVQLPKFYAMSMLIPYAATFCNTRFVMITFRRRYLQFRAHAIHESSDPYGQTARFQQLGNDKVLRKFAHA